METTLNHVTTTCPHCRWPLKKCDDGICRVCNWPVYGSCIECGHVLPNNNLTMCPKCHYPTGRFPR